MTIGSRSKKRRIGSRSGNERGVKEGCFRENRRGGEKACCKGGGEGSSAEAVIPPIFCAGLSRIATKRLIAPSLEREIRNDLTEKAEEAAIGVFRENLRQLLLQPPISGKVVLALDPAYRTGCKIAVIDYNGQALGNHCGLSHAAAEQNR